MMNWDGIGLVSIRMAFAAILLALVMLIPEFAKGGERRLALVIGNSDYEYVSKLSNPVNDSEDLAAALKRIGFEVTLGKNMDYRQMRIALRDFAEQAAQADIVLVYFAGHGIEIENTNYLIPVNAEFRSDRDVEFEAIRLDTIVKAISGLSGLKIVLVDACRNNPFIVSMTRTSATRSIGRGLARVDPTGVLVGYAARSGTLAQDGDGRNSPYATALLKHIEQPGLELGKMFRKIRDTVLELTGGYQEPFTYGSLPGSDIFLVPNVELVTLRPPTSASLDVEGNEVTGRSADPDKLDTATALDEKEILSEFALAEIAGDVSAWDAFLKKYTAIPTHTLYIIALRSRRMIAPDVDGEQNPSEETRSETEAAREIQTILKRRSCYRGTIDGILGRGSKSGLERLNVALRTSFRLPSAGNVGELHALTIQLRNAAPGNCTALAAANTSVAEPTQASIASNKQNPEPADVGFSMYKKGHILPDGTIVLKKGQVYQGRNPCNFSKHLLSMQSQQFTCH